MDNPAGRALIETVRKINEMGRRARSGEPSVEEYLRALGSDPVTEWFTALLREKSEELENERQRADKLAGALREWYQAKYASFSDERPDGADSQLVGALREMGIVA